MQQPVAIRQMVTGHWSEGSQVRSVTGPNPNPNMVVDLRKKEILNNFSYVTQ